MTLIARQFCLDFDLHFMPNFFLRFGTSMTFQMLQQTVPYAGRGLGRSLDGLAIIMNILSSGLHGFRANEWTDIGGRSWPTPRTPVAINDAQIYASLAANTDAHI